MVGNVLTKVVKFLLSDASSYLIGQTIQMDGKLFGEEFDECFDPAFSPDGSKVLVKARNGAEYIRIVADLGEFK